MLRNTILCSAAALLLVASLTACGNQDDTSSVVSEESAPSSVAEVKYENINPLTGENNLATSAKGQRPIAFMINNNPNARPHWGLCSADVVIEGLVEGGSTRMMWLFSDVSNVPKIGSLRSMRHDFVEIADGFDLVWWGGAKTKKPILLFLQMVWMNLMVLATKAHIFSVITLEMLP